MRLIARALLAATAVVALGACQATVRMDVVLDASGGGTFAIEMGFDEDAVERITQAGSIGDLEAFFARLHDRGWAVQRQGADEGPRLYRAARPFRDAAGLDRALDELGSATPAGSPGLPAGFRLTFDYDTARGLLSERASFEGTFDTTAGPEAPEEVRQVLALLAEVVAFEVRATLPGSVEITEGTADLEDRTVVWRPSLGTAMTFGATGSALRVGPLLALLLPALALLGLGVWWLMGRNRGELVTQAIMPEPAAVEPAPRDEVDEILEIERDPAD